MLWLVVRALLSGVIVAIVAEVAKRSPALVASLPVISVLGMMWLWHDTQEPERLARHAEATFWFVLPSLPMFLLIPALLRRGIGFWPSLTVGCLLTVVLYLLMTWVGQRFGLRL